MSSPNSYSIGSYVLFGIIGIVLLILAGLQIGVVKGKIGQSSFFKDITYKNSTVANFLPSTPLKWMLLVFGILLIVPIALVIVGAENQTGNGSGISNAPTAVPSGALKEQFGTGTGTDTYKSIGSGPLIDKIKVNNWINGFLPSQTTSNFSSWPDGNGNMIQINSTSFKSLYGFMPPSFSYYPEGQQSNNYNASNYQTGRQNCMTACSMTNCIAVQTEVPENCSQKQAPGNSSANTCGNNSTFSCSLFYDSLQNADDGYWTLQHHNTSIGGTGSGCMNTSTDACLGNKYYENQTIPTNLPDMNTLPSQSIVKFCGPTAKKTGNSIYGTNPGAATCSCTGASCTNPNCCIIRDIITTEYIQNTNPYYALPIKIYDAKSVSAPSGSIPGSYSMVVSALNVDNAGNTTKCGLITDIHGNYSSVASCNTTACQAPGSTNCWKVDPSKCSGDIYTGPNTSGTPNAAATALATFKSGGATDYNLLESSCYYLQLMSQVTPVEFNCPTDTVTRGCVNGPPIIFTSNLSGEYGACSSNSIIPQSARCQENPSTLSSCTGFPYSCGSNNGSNNLWMRE